MEPLPKRSTRTKTKTAESGTESQVTESENNISLKWNSTVHSQPFMLIPTGYLYMLWIDAKDFFLLLFRSNLGT